MEEKCKGLVAVHNDSDRQKTDLQIVLRLTLNILLKYHMKLQQPQEKVMGTWSYSEVRINQSFSGITRLLKKDKVGQIL